MVIGRIYYSREDRINDIAPDTDRVQWDVIDDDISRIEDVSKVLGENIDELEDALNEYLDALYEIGEDADVGLGYARRRTIERWALAQAALSKMAWVLRIDGNEAYERMIAAIKDGEAVNMSDL